MHVHPPHPVAASARTLFHVLSTMHSTLSSTTRLALRASSRRLALPTRSPPLRRPFSASSSSSAAQTAAQTGPAAVQQALAALTSELDRLAPRFEIAAGKVQVLRTPAEFYSTLKTKIRGAKERVFLATLYVGKDEEELIEVIAEACRKNEKLRVEILTDALRGTRETPGKCSASLLAGLVREFGERVEVRMYHTPDLSGVKKKVIPKRLNEGWGLQHMKLYGVDDEIILSGANLSSDYFTNRQDRYHLYISREITDYYHSIHRAVSSFSFLVLPQNTAAGYKLIWPGSNPGPSPLHSPKAFKHAATSALAPLLRPRTPPSPADLTKTFLYPLGQFTPISSPFDISTEKPGLSLVLSSLSSPSLASSSWTFTAGYFNIHPSLKTLLLASQSSSGTIITASPQANGFYGSKGISGVLPPAYTLLSRRFLADVVQAGKGNVFTLKEWRNGTVGEPGAWTYHAKGVWVSLPGEAEVGPTVTMVGSSNFTRRSYSLDLEMNALLVTGEERLKRELKAEVDNLETHAKKVGMEDLREAEKEHKWYVKPLLWLFEKKL